MDAAKAEAKYQKRCDAVRAVQNGEPPSVVARVFRVPVRSVFYWLSRYRTGGWHNLKEGARKGRPRKLSPELMQWLYDGITLGDPRQFQLPFALWTLNIIRTVLKNQKGVELSKSAICRLLQHMGLTPQRPTYSSYKQNPDAIDAYLNKTYPGLLRKAKRLGASIFFVDESSVRSDHHRGTTWGASGKTPVVKDSGERFSVNLVSAVSARGDMHFRVLEGKMNSDVFVEFLVSLRDDAGRPIIVIADNATYHSSKTVKEFVDQTDGEISLVHLPPYAPELNPDEQVWNHAKARLGRLFIDSRESMRTAVASVLKAIQDDVLLIKSFFCLKTTRYAK